jgi:phosphoglycerate-specific signal transduction histidine kinase
MKLVSERQKHEQLLIQQSKMAAMGEMLGNIAHQWRQPLSHLSGIFMDLESAYLFGELNQKYIQNSVGEANDTIEYMSSTIDDFINFSHQ